MEHVLKQNILPKFLDFFHKTAWGSEQTAYGNKKQWNKIIISSGETKIHVWNPDGRNQL